MAIDIHNFAKCITMSNLFLAREKRQTEHVCVMGVLPSQSRIIVYYKSA